MIVSTHEKGYTTIADDIIDIDGNGKVSKGEPIVTC